MKNDFYVYHDGELYHHGIKGQKWGEQNGPPYPLDKSDHSAAERKFDTGKTSKESRSEKTGSGKSKTWTGKYGNAYDKTVSDEEAQNFWKSYAKSLQSEQSGKSNNSSTVVPLSRGNENDPSVSDKEASDFWKSYAKNVGGGNSDSSSQRSSSNSDSAKENRQKVSSEAYKLAGISDASKASTKELLRAENAYEEAQEYLAETKGNSYSSKELKNEFDFFYSLSGSSSNVSNSTRSKGKSFVSRHS